MFSERLRGGFHRPLQSILYSICSSSALVCGPHSGGSASGNQKWKRLQRSLSWEAPGGLSQTLSTEKSFHNGLQEARARVARLAPPSHWASTLLPGDLHSWRESTGPPGVRHSDVGFRTRTLCTIERSERSKEKESWKCQGKWQQKVRTQQIPRAKKKSGVGISPERTTHREQPWVREP